MRLFLRIFLTLLLAPPLISIVLGWIVAPAFLHPIRRALTPDLIQQADVSFDQLGAKRSTSERPTACFFAVGKFARHTQMAPGSCSSTESRTIAWGPSNTRAFFFAPATASR